MKMLSIEGTDGKAFLGYAGLGSSRSRTEPSAWMNDILKGKPRLSIEEQLGLIANAMKAELPRHLAMTAGTKSHVLIATAMINGTVRLYQLSVDTLRNSTTPHLIYTRHEKSCGVPPPFAVTGSGAQHLLKRKGWHRELLRIVQAVETGRVNPLAVADRIAAINEMVSVQDPMVSKKCIVIWWASSGSFQFYDGKLRVGADKAIPSIANGMDIQDFARSIMPTFLNAFSEIQEGGKGEINIHEINEKIKREYNRKKYKI